MGPGAIHLLSGISRGPVLMAVLCLLAWPAWGKAPDAGPGDPTPTATAARPSPEHRAEPRSADDVRCDRGQDSAAVSPAIPLTPSLQQSLELFSRARCLQASGRLEEAQISFRQGMAQSGTIPQLWHFHLLRALLAAGNHEQAVQEMGMLLENAPGKVLNRRVQALILERVVEADGLPAEVLAAYLRTYLERRPPSAKDYDLMTRLWQLAQGTGDARLQDWLALLMWRHPEDAEAAARWAPLPQMQGPRETGNPQAADYLARAMRLFGLELYDPLARELGEASLPQLDTGTAKALGRLYFRSLIRGRHLQRAAVQINTGSVIRRFAFDERQRLIWAIRIQLKRRKIGTVLKYLRLLEQGYPDESELPSIYLELLKYNRGRNDEVTTRHWFDRIVGEHGQTPEASEAYWLMIRHVIARKAHDEAETLLKRAIGNSASFHPVDQARLYYWKGRLQMRQGENSAGQATWREMESRWPYGYYAALAQWQRGGAAFSQNHASDQGEARAPPRPDIEALWSIEPFPTGIFLFAIGDQELAVEILRDAVSRNMPPDAVEEAGALFHYLGRHYLQLRLVANHHLNTMRRNRVADTPLWRRSFPLPHWDLVREQAGELSIDPYFVLAIMREESRFFISADSSAGAKGLMQLMPDTARMIARRNGLPYEEDMLHVPELNIPLGIHYLKRVLTRFDGNPLYAAAAYNAGPGTVKRWIRHFGHLPLDEFVERIPFGETQRYVKRVFLSYRVYTLLYRQAP